MKTVTPDYFENFRCIADKCRHSCCIGWEIDIDRDTLVSYLDIKNDFGERLRENIDLNGTPHFRLTKDERCPFLDENGLCDIISTLGYGALCQICDDHPRFYNSFPDRVEAGLGLCCEAAAKLILGRKDKTYLCKNLPEDNFNLFRNRIFDIIQDRSLPVDKRADMLLSVCGVSFPDKTPSEWKEIYMHLEMLDAEWKNYLSDVKDFSFDGGDDTPYEQLLVYFIYRHLTPDCDISECILFTVLSYRIIRSIAGDDFEKLLETARTYSSEIEYSDINIEKLLKNIC